MYMQILQIMDIIMVLIECMYISQAEMGFVIMWEERE